MVERRGDSQRQLSREEILRVLPQQARIMYLGSAEITEPGVSAHGTLVDRNTSGLEHLRDHIPGAEIFPATSLLEAVCDLMALVVALEQPNKVGIFISGAIATRRFISPKDTVGLEVVIREIKGSKGKASGIIRGSDGRVIGRARVRFGLVDREQLTS